MAIAGDIVLFRFPQTNLKTGKLRPALLIKKLPYGYQDWLACMISSRIKQQIVQLDEIITFNDSDFSQTGLKSESVIRVSRLAVVSESILLGKIGSISAQRLERIKVNLSNWILT
ncbi:MAG: type II toxin-antitoxin system PemK/MazF family toxin [Crocosphaera sp.]|nr:type II toxin-antitoxin system PemK/MazF family toxin [Crocosphaera sp.]